MFKKPAQLIVASALIGAILACSGLPGGNDATQAPLATEAPLATAAPKATNAPKPTSAPKATNAPKPTSASSGSGTLETYSYDHPSGAFSIDLPKDWEVKERADGIFLESEDSVLAIEVNFTNVGRTLSEDELNNFINAIEQNWFATFDNYSAGDPEVQGDGSIGLLKTLETNGVTQKVFSYYWQKENVVYEQDFWIEESEYDTYVDAFIDIANSMQTDESAAESANTVYYGSYTFTAPDSLFEMAMPYAWTYETTSGDNSIIDTFTSPDGASLIESIVYDDGTEVTKADAGAFALQLLKDAYGYDDIKVTDDEVQSDGSERLNWNSAAHDVDGTSFFETRGTTFLLLTWIVNTDDYDLFYDMWVANLDTYTIP